MTVQEALNIAMGHHQAGLLDQAEGVYRQVLSADPGNPDALHLLGLVENQRGNFVAAELLIRKSLEKSPEEAFIWSDLALALMNQGKMKEAFEVCARILELDPRQELIHYYQGIIYYRMEQYALAAEAFKRETEIHPTFQDAWVFLADALNKSGNPQEALAMNQRLMERHPDSAVLRFNQGVILASLGRLREAVELLKAAIALDPNNAQAYNNLGIFYGKLGEDALAVESFEKSIGINPRLHEVHNNLANALKKMGKYDPALGSYHRALELFPQFAAGYSNLGNLYKDMGLLDEALAAFKRSLSIAPQPEIHGNLLFAMQYHPGCDMGLIHRELKNWNNLYAFGQDQNPATFSGPEPAKLKVGFVSGDLREHPAGRFLLPLLANLERERFIVTCYSNSLVQDGLSETIKTHVDAWTDVSAMTNEQLDQRIRQDGIHILIDLSAHTSGNRLMTMARKPAPLQMTWLAYCGSTGLKTIDYRISDGFIDPPGMFDPYYSEKTLRMPSTWWCYAPPGVEAPVSPLPRLGKGTITFGCLNNFCKISPMAMECWIEILKHTEGSRLLVHAGEGSCRERFIEAFRSGGVDPSRLGFVGYLPRGEYFKVYREIDIALDPFPYNGGMTSCDALWMGVPVIALEGDRPVGRAGLSILCNMGLRELAGRDAGHYIELAVGLARDISRLERLRGSLRERMLGSPLMDGARFARDFSALLREAWREKFGGAACRA